MTTPERSRTTSNLISQAYFLARRGALGMAQQADFASRYLDLRQRRDYLDLCVRVRESEIDPVQSLYDAVESILTTRTKP